VGVVSFGIQLAESCIKLHSFWESIEDAPHEIAAIKEDLQFLVSVFQRIESNEDPLGHCTIEGVYHCRVKVAVRIMDCITGQKDTDEIGIDGYRREI
jgi:hypothetical protein